MTREDVNIELLEEEVESTKQYPFASDTFRRIFYEVFGDDFTWFDLFFDKKEYNSFVLWHSEDTWYVYSARLDVTVCWYKGLGRINQCSEESFTEEGLRTFFTELRNEFKEKTKPRKRVIGLDIECYDPLLKTAGWSWKYDQGYILNIALYYEDIDRVEVIPGLHNDNCPYDLVDRQCENKKIIDLLTDKDVCIVGANLQYDIGWLLHEYKMTTYDVKCSFVDVLQAEAILDEFGFHSLESVSQKYLKYGKTKDRIEDWVRENVKGKGDFRAYLKDAPWGLLCEYVTGDAKNPVKVWRKQLTLLTKQNLCKRAKLEFDCILPTLQMSMNGIPFDNEGRKRNYKELVALRDELKKSFEDKYGFKTFNVNSSKHIAAICDKFNIPYKCKITLKGQNGEKFTDYRQLDNACARAKRLISSFHFVKSVPVAYVPSELAERSCALLEEEGYMFTCSPNVDKKFFASQRDNYEIIGLIADWKLANGIISKILGDKYERFICPDGKVRPQFNITDTISFRYSSNMPNFQQIPSKNGLKAGDKEFSFPAKIRTLCHAPKGCIFGKIDYGQIEYRLICNIACGQSGEEVRRQYAENPKMDFHQYVVDLTGLSRKYAKNMSFGVSFGMGLKSMADNFGWTLEHAEEISEAYHKHMPFVQPTLELVGDVAKKRGYIITAGGSHARLPNPNKSYTMLNRYTQGSGAECLKTAIVNAYKEGVWERLKVANTIHDELNMPYVPVTEQGVIDLFRMAELMRNAMPTLRVPLEASPEIGTDWYNVKEYPDWIKCRDNKEEDWFTTSQEVRDFVNLTEKLLKEGKIVL